MKIAALMMPVHCHCKGKCHLVVAKKNLVTILGSSWCLKSSEVWGCKGRGVPAQSGGITPGWSLPSTGVPLHGCILGAEPWDWSVSAQSILHISLPARDLPPGSPCSQAGLSSPGSCSCSAQEGHEASTSLENCFV